MEGVSFCNTTIHVCYIKSSSLHAEPTEGYTLSSQKGFIAGLNFAVSVIHVLPFTIL